MNFSQLSLIPQILKGVESVGYTTPTAIQEQAIPVILDGRDVLGLAQTGTGKTAAFALPIMQILSLGNRGGIRSLIIAPTRELAEQITQMFNELGQGANIGVIPVYGGVSKVRQVAAIRRGPDVVVACPGRLLDLINDRSIDLSRVEILVLDAADNMGDMGFLPDLKRILKQLPAERQNLLFSATMPREIRTFADSLLQNPHVVELTRDGPADTIEHVLVAVAETRKRDLLEYILGQEGCTSAIVFTRTKHRAKRLAEQLSRAKYRAVALQGNMSQSQRDRAMEGFRKRRFDILVATDIAARGIDVKGVSHVLNYDVPNTPEAYTHRIGRTGCAELEGQAVTFVTRDDVSWLRDTERKLGEKIPRRTVAGFEGESIDTGPGRKSSGRPGGRPGGNGAKRSGGGGQKRSGSRSGDQASSRGRGRSRSSGSSSRGRRR